MLHFVGLIRPITILQIIPSCFFQFRYVVRFWFSLDCLLCGLHDCKTIRLTPAVD